MAWNSGDTSVATVSASGLVTGVSAGKAQITATSAAQQAACTVTVLGLVFDKSEKAALVSTPLRVGRQLYAGLHHLRRIPSEQGVT